MKHHSKHISSFSSSASKTIANCKLRVNTLPMSIKQNRILFLHSPPSSRLKPNNTNFGRHLTKRKNASQNKRIGTARNEQNRTEQNKIE